MSTPTLPPPDPLDAHLRAFFRREMGQFPECPVPADAPAPRRPAATADGGRLVLSASVAAIVGLGLALPNTAPAPRADGRPAAATTASTLLQDATADGGNLLELAKPMGP